ncbi:MAG: hypothetical protein ACJ72Z_10600 [Pyrinomonadaceae bacterium]
MKIILCLIALSFFTGVAFSQARHPSSASKPFVIKSKADVDTMTKALASQEGNVSRDIVAAKGMQTRVALFDDKKRENDMFELHDSSDDIYYVLAGEATLAIGGELVEPTEISPGEWRSKTVKGGNPFRVKKGDLVVVPRGTVHQRTVVKKGFSMILVKVFATEQK